MSFLQSKRGTRSDPRYITRAPLICDNAAVLSRFPTLSGGPQREAPAQAAREASSPGPSARADSQASIARLTGIPQW